LRSSFIRTSPRFDCPGCWLIILIFYIFVRFG
jgi:hypothetical protein